MSNPMGPAVTAKTEAVSHAIPADLAAVALIDAPTCAAAGAMSVSWWHDEVRAGRAPKPAVQQPRCTRWRLAEVREFWQAFAERGTCSPAARALVDNATRASKAALAKRKAVTQAA